MAVVFISPKQRQKTFFLGITGAVVISLLLLSLTVFLSQPKEVAPELVFNKPKIKIDADILDSEKFKSLLPFSKIKTQFSYSASKGGKTISGFVAAVSKEEAQKTLEGAGFASIRIEEVKIGRENPFTPY